MKRSASFYIGLFLIGVLPLVALNCPTDVEKDAEILGDGSAYTVNEVSGLPSFTYAGSTTIAFVSEGGDNVSSGSFTVTDAVNLPRIVVADEQVEFPSDGTYTVTGLENGGITGITLTTNGVDIPLTVVAFSDEGTLDFTYEGAEPKVADLATVTVKTTR